MAALEARPWRYPPSFDFQYGGWLRREFEGRQRRTVAANEPRRLLTDHDGPARAAPLLGPPPAEVFDPVPRDDLIRAIVGDIDGLLGDLAPDTPKRDPDPRPDLEHHGD